MKELKSKKIFVTKIHQALSSTSNIDELLESLIIIYNFLAKSCPCSLPFKTKKVRTKSLQFSVFYQPGLDMSEHAISISHNDYETILWTDKNEWVLNDECLEIDEIANSLSENPIIDQYPENVLELKMLLDKRYWMFKPELFPKFSGNPPQDLNEILSWDSKYILTGISKDNLSIMTRDEWEQLSKRQNR